MLPQQWAQPCGNRCTQKYASLTQIPFELRFSLSRNCLPSRIGMVGRVFCKKGCDSDGKTWEDCLADCEEKCYKDPVFKDRQWSAYIDRSPGAGSYSVECFNACKSGCGYKFEVHPEIVVQVRPNRPCNPSPTEKPPRLQKSPPEEVCHGEPTEDMPCTSA